MINIEVFQGKSREKILHHTIDFNALKNDSVKYGKLSFQNFHACNRGSTPRGDAIKENRGLGNVTGPFFFVLQNGPRHDPPQQG
jgi:hypothetical protein